MGLTGIICSAKIHWTSCGNLETLLSEPVALCIRPVAGFQWPETWCMAVTPIAVWSSLDGQCWSAYQRRRKPDWCRDDQQLVLNASATSTPTVTLVRSLSQVSEGQSVLHTSPLSLRSHVLYLSVIRSKKYRIGDSPHHCRKILLPGRQLAGDIAFALGSDATPLNSHHVQPQWSLCAPRDIPPAVQVVGAVWRSTFHHYQI